MKKCGYVDTVLLCQITLTAQNGIAMQMNVRKILNIDSEKMTKESDFLDEASNLTIMETESLVNASRKAVLDMPEGEPGECNECGEFNKRLVYGRCSPCRDGRY